MMVRGGGLEPPRHCWRQDLNLVRLPISPPAQSRLDSILKNRHAAHSATKFIAARNFYALLITSKPLHPLSCYLILPLL